MTEPSRLDGVLAGSMAVFGLGGLLSDVVPARDLLAASGGVVMLYAGCGGLPRAACVRPHRRS